MTVSQPGGAPGRPSSTTELGAPGAPEDAGAGAMSGRFRSLFVIGRGGMGSIEVALVATPGGGSRIVALKRMLPSAVRDKRLTEMFLREAKLASMLDHPNVVHATSFGERDGVLYLVMEYIEGEPLSRVVAVSQERGIRLALPLVAHVLAEICEGLHAAHELTDDTGRPLNVVHRDVSPQNVMVAYEGQAKLLDFGVAKIEALEADGKTKTGEVKGKTAYMSPEQAMGDPIDRRSDLYSLGAVLFEAVSGRKMWGGGTDLEVLRRMAREEPPSLEEAAPGTPDAIVRLHKRLVARDPATRPATALQVARDLRTFIASTGTRPDARMVRSLMIGLFAGEIDRRRAALEHALENVAPSADAAELSASLRTLPGSDVTPVPATRRLGASGAWPRSPKTWVTAGIGVVAATLALGVVARVGSKSTPAPPSSSAAVATTESAQTAPAQSAASAEPTSTQEARPLPPSTSAPSANVERNVVSPLQTKPATPSQKAIAPRELPSKPPVKDKLRPASTKPAGPLDVDPAPF